VPLGRTRTLAFLRQTCERGGSCSPRFRARFALVADGASTTTSDPICASTQCPTGWPFGGVICRGVAQSSMPRGCRSRDRARYGCEPPGRRGRRAFTCSGRNRQWDVRLNTECRVATGVHMQSPVELSYQPECRGGRVLVATGRNPTAVPLVHNWPDCVHPMAVVVDEYRGPPRRR